MDWSLLESMTRPDFVSRNVRKVVHEAVVFVGKFGLLRRVGIGVVSLLVRSESSLVFMVLCLVRDFVLISLAWHRRGSVTMVVLRMVVRLGSELVSGLLAVIGTIDLNVRGKCRNLGFVEALKAGASASVRILRVILLGSGGPSYLLLVGRHLSLRLRQPIDCRPVEVIAKSNASSELRASVCEVISRLP